MAYKAFSKSYANDPGNSRVIMGLIYCILRETEQQNYLTRDNVNKLVQYVSELEKISPDTGKEVEAEVEVFLRKIGRR